MTHDPLSPYDLVHDEINQLRETGYRVERFTAALADIDPRDGEALLRLYERLLDAEQDPDWAYEEPSELSEILRLLPAVDESGIEGPLDDRILGGWLGRVAGCNLGKPVEQGDHWTVERLRQYLQAANAYPLRDYIPRLDPMPPGFVMRDNWPYTTLGSIHGSDRDDDIDYSILGLLLLERHGAGLQPEHVAAAWLELLPYLQVFTAERATYRNLLLGIPATATACYRNPYREWIGATIRADIFGWTHPGRPRAAALLAYQDARLSHAGNGIYGEMWAAALIAAAFTAAGPRAAVERSLNHVPASSRLAEAVRHVLDLNAQGLSWDAATQEIQTRYRQYSWVHTVNNAAALTAGLLWGEGDYTRTVGLTVQGGWDTDSNGATAGSVLGVLLGAAALPAHFIEPLADSTRSALFGFDHSSISELAVRTTRLAMNGLAP